MQPFNKHKFTHITPKHYTRIYDIYTSHNSTTSSTVHGSNAHPRIHFKLNSICLAMSLAIYTAHYAPVTSKHTTFTFTLVSGSLANIALHARPLSQELTGAMKGEERVWEPV